MSVFEGAKLISGMVLFAVALAYGVCWLHVKLDD